MKKSIYVLVLLASSWGHAQSVSFHTCQTNIQTEEFGVCKDGEGKAGVPCSAKVTQWGTLQVDLTADSAAKRADAVLVYQSSQGQKIKSSVHCALDNSNWMNCTTATPVPVLGKLTVSFNIDGIKPQVYFVQVMADATNVPVGEFQTELNCQKQ